MSVSPSIEPITHSWANTRCLARRYFDSGPQHGVALVCTRLNNHKGNHEMNAPMWPRFEWTPKGRLVKKTRK